MCKTPAVVLSKTHYFCLYISSMNTSSSHEALIKAAEIIRKLSDGLSSAHFSLTVLEKDLLKKYGQELYECLLALETNETTFEVTTRQLQDSSDVVDTTLQNIPVTEEVKIEPEPQIQSKSEIEIPPVVAMSPFFQPAPEMEIEEVDEVAENSLEQISEEERQLSLLQSVEEVAAHTNDKLEENPAETIVPAEELTVSEQKTNPDMPPPVSHIPEEVEEEELTLNEKISKTAEKKSFLDRMMLTPIDNIKSHITLNKKVAFIIGLFNQESEEYNKAIDQLNTADNLQAALDIYHMLKTRYSWNPEQDLVKELEMLVRRRFSSGV